MNIQVAENVSEMASSFARATATTTDYVAFHHNYPIHSFLTVFDLLP